MTRDDRDPRSSRGRSSQGMGSRSGSASRNRRPASRSTGRSNSRTSYGARTRDRSYGSRREYDYEEDYEYNRRRSSSPRSGGKRKKAKKRKRIILFVVEILVLLVMLAFLYTVLKTEKVEKVQIDEDSIVMNENVEASETLKGYRNIALFGVDSREGALGKGTRTDTIIIASINQDTGDVKLCSVFRDTYLNQSNDSYNKANAAYATGGPEQAINMLNMNLDLNITDYITVGFDGLIEVIDALGGVEVNVTDAEIPHLNNYQISMVGKSSDGKTFTAKEGTDYIAVTKSGTQNLNGLQATAYCRIRYVGNDFARAERQRTVIKAISEKAKNASVSELNDVVNGVMDNVATSLDVSEILGVLGELGKYSIVGSDGFPFEEYRDTGTIGSKGSCVIPVTLEKNVSALHDFLFEEKNYQVSNEVKQYSSKISSDTGRG